MRYLETPDGRRVCDDINANWNPAAAIADAFGFDPFDRVVAFLSREVEKGRATGTVKSQDSGNSWSG